MMKTIYDTTGNFINRELSWLEFNQRVLEGALDAANPLFERLNFLAIVSSNLDEFFAVRVASLGDQILAGLEKRDPSGLLPQECMAQIVERAHGIVEGQYRCYRNSLLKKLRKENINIVNPKSLTKDQKKFVKDYYLHKVFPVLTPLVVDQGRPFPLLRSRELYIALLIKGVETHLFATVQVPKVLPRFVEVPSATKDREFIMLEDLITLKLPDLFQGHKLAAAGFFRITRNADLDFDEEGAEDLLEAIELSIRQRKWGSVIRLEVGKGFHKDLLAILKEELEITEDKIYEVRGPIDLTFLSDFIKLKGCEHLRYLPFQPQDVPELIREKDIFKAIQEQDILLHHPYQSFQPVVELVKTAARDPQVLAIKQTLYRVSGNSPIIAALAQAAELGKQVTVLVELKARFDEEKNIHWAKHLEEAGCHVIYGLVGLKTHCKVLLIVRREEDGIKRYVHMSTGNYNDVTAKIYTDIGLMTVNPQFGADASALFNMLSGLSQPVNLNKFTLAPAGMREKFLQLIEDEAHNAQKGMKAVIVVKVNSLLDKQIILALYHASSQGVEIKLIVRGVCCLRPGLPGVSETIAVRSIVGRFLEHSRIFYFYHGGEELVYLSSADWMPRNLDRRVELLFPVENPDAKEEVKAILDIAWQDTVKARILNAKGIYKKVDKRRKKSVESQDALCERAVAQSTREKARLQERLEGSFHPVTAGAEMQGFTGMK
ncbi:Polyphosphate kinase [Desulfitobacterium hafniense DCB-2]|uniref:Polyphosphate kinase n=1 Tax=Desulfitobacterium hafniense (strain DSM 10664 / DCB-2) TaxID=272564 RepID=B8FS05_DESHD|nr:RNA degradosome polyphosphate kinase [Desulfitobacterium hafniense]ACL20143.1 Polyphosphate kinase [Desulfitobacterium hafniense DCB-2]